MLVFERWDDRAAVEAFRGAGPGDEQLEVIEEFVVNEYDVVTSAPPQELRAALAAIPVHDMAKAEIWYSSLLGSEPDSRPMDGLVEWRPTTSSVLQLVIDPDRSGGGW